MSHINLHVTAQFERDLRALMKLRRIRQKSEAIRLAVREAVERLRGHKPDFDFHAMLGLAQKLPKNPKPKFLNEDELWTA